MNIGKHIVICSTQRSGSTYLCECIEKAGWGIPREGYLTAIRKHSANEDFNYQTALDAIQKRSSANGFSSVKIMANYLSSVEQIHARNMNSNTDSESSIEEQLDSKFKYFTEYYSDAIFIWLRRENIVKQALSRIYARKTGIYHSSKLDKEDQYTQLNKDIGIQDKVVDKEIFKISCENSMWQNYFDSNRIPYCSVSYEELERTSDDIIQKIANQFSLEVKKTDSQLSLKKLANKHTENVYIDQIKRLARTVNLHQ